MKDLQSLENNLRAHIRFLCEAPRTPKSPHYFKTQDYLKGVLRELKLEPKEHLFSVWGLNDCKNIYAESHSMGTKPRLLIGAHYETAQCSGLGADDNASAVAVALELTRALLLSAKAEFTIVFFDMEEIHRLKDLQGSRAFQKFYQKPIERVVIMDLVGGAFAPGFEKVFLQFGLGLPRLLSDQAEFLHLPMVVLEPVGTIGARSDYHSFRKSGIPFTFVSSGTPWYYHTPHDRPDVLHFSKMAALTKSFVDSLQNPRPIANVKEPTEDFLRFLKLLSETKALRSPVAEKILREERLPSRIEMIRLYKHILLTLRKWGPKLWESGAPLNRT
jgi:hypothetical protein